MMLLRIRNSVSLKKSGTIYKADVYDITYYCRHHVGIASVLFVLQTTDTWDSHAAGSKIPSAYRPTIEWSCSGFFNNSQANGRIYINTDGQICYQTLEGTIASGDQIRGTLVWYYS